MEKADENIEDVLARIPPSPTLLKIFSDALGKQVPKEPPMGSMTPPTPRPLRYFWRPNNYRRKCKVLVGARVGKKIPGATDPTLPTLVGFLQERFVKVEAVTQNKMVYVRDYRNIVFEIGKETLTCIWFQNIVAGEKETFMIERQTMPEVNAAIDAKVVEIKELMRAALESFLAKTGWKVHQYKEGELDERGKPTTRYEDFLKGEEYIDRIPRECIIHDTVFKKVYGEGIEFKQSGNGEEPVVHMKNYINNRAVEDIAPTIAKAIDEIGAKVDSSEETKKLLLEAAGILKQQAIVQRGIQENQVVFDQNMQSHIRAVQALGTGVLAMNKTLHRLSLQVHALKKRRIKVVEGQESLGKWQTTTL